MWKGEGGSISLGWYYLLYQTMEWVWSLSFDCHTLWSLEKNESLIFVANVGGNNENSPVLFSFLSMGMNSFQKAHDVALGPSPVPVHLVMCKI